MKSHNNEIEKGIWMKKVYERPMVTVEKYELNTMIASGCSLTINLGPGGDNIHDVCSDFGPEPWSISAFSLTEWVEGCRGGRPQDYRSFYEDSCDCKYTIAGEGYFTS